MPHNFLLTVIAIQRIIHIFPNVINDINIPQSTSLNLQLTQLIHWYLSRCGNFILYGHGNDNLYLANSFNLRVNTKGQHLPSPWASLFCTANLFRDTSPKWIASPQTSFGVCSSFISPPQQINPVGKFMNSSVYLLNYLQDSVSLILVLLCNYKFLAHPIKSLTDRANLNKRLGLRFTKIFKRPVIGEHKCRLCLAHVRGGEMNAWRANPKGRLRGGYEVNWPRRPEKTRLYRD